MHKGKLFHWIILTSSIWLFYSCTVKAKQNDWVIMSLNVNISTSATFVDLQNFKILKEMEKKLTNPSTAYKAKEWYPKALKIKMSMDSIQHYIDSLKTALKREAHLTMILYKGDSVESYNMDDQSAVQRYCIEQGNAEILKNRIVNFENNVLAVDRTIDSIFRSRTNDDIPLYDRFHDEAPKSFGLLYFNNISAITALTVLNKFKEEIYFFCNELLTYCNFQVPDNAMTLH